MAEPAGAYITQTDIEKRIAPDVVRQFCDDNKDGISDVGVIQTLITDAEAEVNQILALSFTVPLSGTVPNAIKLATVDIAIKHMYDRRRVDSKTTEANYKSALLTLTAIVKGELDVGIASTQESVTFNNENGETLQTMAKTEAFRGGVTEPWREQS